MILNSHRAYIELVTPPQEFVCLTAYLKNHIAKWRRIKRQETGSVLTLEVIDSHWQWYGWVLTVFSNGLQRHTLNVYCLCVLYTSWALINYLLTMLQLMHFLSGMISFERQKFWFVC